MLTHLLPHRRRLLPCLRRLPLHSLYCRRRLIRSRLRLGRRLRATHGIKPAADHARSSASQGGMSR